MQELEPNLIPLTSSWSVNPTPPPQKKKKIHVPPYIIQLNHIGFTIYVCIRGVCVCK